MLKKTYLEVLTLILAVQGSTSCKGRNPEQENQVLAAPRTICCRYLEKSGINVDEEYEISHPFSRSECQRHLRTSARTLSDVQESSCAELALPQHWTGVEVCYGKTNFSKEAPGVGISTDTAAYMLKLGHAWIRTPQKEVGMGNRDATADEERSHNFTSALLRRLLLVGLFEKINVRWTDHTDYGVKLNAECLPIYRCELNCVNKRLNIGESLGVYGIGNQCHSTVTHVLKDCGCVNRCVEPGPPPFYRCAKWAYPALHLTKTTK